VLVRNMEVVMEKIGGRVNRSSLFVVASVTLASRCFRGRVDNNDFLDRHLFNSSSYERLLDLYNRVPSVCGPAGFSC
jgi:hypothetical protein